ncbi:NADH-Ubiquinone/plastoquinone (complex I), various chains family protein [Escherichia coli 2-177-06_S3_C2]|nr:NADH-Ubiquinone/plastoquinone (complex I), various chains family protein [Escherichia coli 2-177-06_S3_C2]
MENLALTTLLLPFIGALVVSFSPQRRAAEWGVLFAALTTLCMLSLISAFYQADKVAVTLTLVNVGDVALFGLVIDRVSTLILFVVVFLGLLVTIYSTGYLTDKNREHPHNGTNRYYAFLLVFIGAMAGLVLSSTLLGQLLFFEITGGCSWALISYYQSDKAQRSALKALLITHIGSLGLYLAAATLFLQTGTFALSAMSELHGDARYLVYGGILFAAWGKSGPATDASVATGRNGSANTDQRLSPRRIDGESGRLHFCPRHYRRRQYPACDWRCWHGHGPGHHSLWISDVFATAGYEAVAGLVDHHSTWLDVLRLVALHLRLAAGAGG